MDEYLRRVLESLQAVTSPDLLNPEMLDEEVVDALMQGKEVGGRCTHECRAVKGQEEILIVDVFPEAVVSADGEMRPSSPGRVIVDTTTRTVEGDVQFLPDGFPGRVDENDTRSFEVVWIDASGVEHSDLVQGVTRADFARLLVDAPASADVVDLDAGAAGSSGR